MNQPILIQARNIYEQQAHNRRMTNILIIVFVLLIAFIGAGFDVFIDARYSLRIVMLPFVLLTVLSGLWTFRTKSAARLWEPTTRDDEDWEYSRIKIKIILWGFAFMAFIPILFYPHLLDHFLPRTLNIPFLRYFPLGTMLATLVGIVSVATCLQWGSGSILGVMHVKVMGEFHEAFPQLKNVVDEMSIAAGISVPAIYIVKDTDPNAFAVGSEVHQSAIVVTTGLLDILSREELQGVIAHEMSHIRNNDTRLMTTITVLFGALVLLSDWMKKGSLVGSLAGTKVPLFGFIVRTILLIGWVISLLFAPLLARLLAMAVSRNREYFADAGGAELTRNPIALAQALKKIEAIDAPTFSVPKSIAHLCVIDPLGRKMNSREGWWADLFATHPPIKNRVLLLNAMAYRSPIIREHIAQ
jgi:heat shock protein HtpX